MQPNSLSISNTGRVKGNIFFVLYPICCQDGFAHSARRRTGITRGSEECACALASFHEQNFTCGCECGSLGWVEAWFRGKILCICPLLAQYIEIKSTVANNHTPNKVIYVCIVQFSLHFCYIYFLGASSNSNYNCNRKQNPIQYPFYTQQRKNIPLKFSPQPQIMTIFPTLTTTHSLLK